jgi:hypothetical protein
MNEEQIADVWMLFSDVTFTELLGTDTHLDHAINYYLDIDQEDEIDEEWD